MLSFWLYICRFMALAAVLSSSSLSDDHKKIPNSNPLDGTITVYTTHMFPYHYLDPNTGAPVGTDIALIEAFIISAGFNPPKFQIVPWARALSKASSVPLTLITPLTRSSDREENFHWLLKLRTIDLAIFGQTDEQLTPARIAELGINIYCENGTFQCDLLENAGVPKRQIKPFPVMTSSQVVEMALRGRMPYFIAEVGTVEKELKRRIDTRETLKALYTFPETVDDYLAIHKNNDPELIAALKAAAEKMSFAQ